MTKLTSRTIEEKGVELPWERWSYPAVFKDGVNLTPERPHPSVLEDSGTTFITLNTLYELANQYRWDSTWGSACLLSPPDGLALEAKKWARSETRGGYHGTDKLRKWINKHFGEDFEMEN